MRGEGILLIMGEACAIAMAQEGVPENNVLAWAADWKSRVNLGCSGGLSLNHAAADLAALLTIAKELVGVHREERISNEQKRCTQDITRSPKGGSGSR